MHICSGFTVSTSGSEIAIFLMQLPPAHIRPREPPASDEDAPAGPARGCAARAAHPRGEGRARQGGHVRRAASRAGQVGIGDPTSGSGSTSRTLL